MDFFNAQDKARRNTLRLILLFATAVAVLVVLTNLLVAGFLLYFTDYGNYSSVPVPDRVLSVDEWFSISLAVLVVVSGASLYKYMMVKGGGRAVAESLGGRQLDPNDPDPAHRRLLNVVEEMAIASGISVPPVYLIPDSAINAFAAGFSFDDAVIGVTEGTVELLSRDELQGVVGHEFSHLFNGDTRINLRLIAVLHGILFIGIIGHLLLRSGTYRSWNVGSRRSSNNSAPLLLLGLGLLVVGYAGTFFGNLIKAAVSRQREFLADAASVQFTRNPQGIADALKKIGGYSDGSIMHVARAEELSHMFFGQGVKLFLNTLMATHPPLSERILAIEPSWDGKFPQVSPLPGGLSSPQESAEKILSPHFNQSSDTGVSGLVTQDVEVEVIRESQSEAAEIAQSVGRPTQAHLDAARELINTTQKICQDAARDAWGARALLYAMLLTKNDQFSEIVYQQAEAGVPEYMEKLQPSVEALNYQQRLMLLSMAIPALKRLSMSQYRTFIANLIQLIKADNRIDLFEWVMHRILLKELKPHFEKVEHPKIRYENLTQVKEAVAELFSSLARLNNESDRARVEFQQACDLAEIEADYVDEDDPNFARLNSALSRLRQLKPLSKPKLIKSCAAILLNNPNEDQLALLQGIAATLDCPLPPTLRTPSQ